MELEEKFREGVLVRFKATTRAYGRNLGMGVVEQLGRDGVVTVVDIQPVNPLEPLKWGRRRYKINHTGLEIVKPGMELITYSVWN